MYSRTVIQIYSCTVVQLYTAPWPKALTNVADTDSHLQLLALVHSTLYISTALNPLKSPVFTKYPTATRPGSISAIVIPVLILFHMIIVISVFTFLILLLFTHNFRGPMLNTTCETTVSIPEDSDEQQEVIEVQILPQVPHTIARTKGIVLCNEANEISIGLKVVRLHWPVLSNC